MPGRPIPCSAILRFFPPVEGHVDPTLPQTYGQAPSRPWAFQRPSCTDIQPIPLVSVPGQGRGFLPHREKMHPRGGTGRTPYESRPGTNTGRTSALPDRRQDISGLPAGKGCPKGTVRPTRSLKEQTVFFLIHVGHAPYLPAEAAPAYPEGDGPQASGIPSTPYKS